MIKNDYVFRYRVRNWCGYNRALIARGQLTFWFDEDTIAGWQNTELCSGPGTLRIYSDTAIQCALILKSVFHLSLRATQGFLGSVVELMKLELPVPDYSTVSRMYGRYEWRESSGCTPAESSGEYLLAIQRAVWRSPLRPAT